MITIYRGDTHTIKVTVTDDDGAFDLTDWTANFTVKGDLKSSKKMLNKTVKPIPNPELGIIVFELTSLETDLPIGEHYFDVEISTNDEPQKVHTVICDKIKVLQDATN